MLSVIVLSVIMLSVIVLSVIMLSVIVLSVIMLSVVMLSVIMLSVTFHFLYCRIGNWEIWLKHNILFINKIKRNEILLKPKVKGQVNFN